MQVKLFKNFSKKVENASDINPKATVKTKNESIFLQTYPEKNNQHNTTNH